MLLSKKMSAAGCFINGVIEHLELICDIRDECGTDSQGLRIIAARNPVLYEDSEAYFSAIRRSFLM